MSNEVLVKVENVSKKFCRDLKKSLWYGVSDIACELTGRNNQNRNLRPKEFWALKDISFELKRGEVLGLIGRNGAGKTTLLKVLNNLIKPDAGRVTMRGRVGALIALGAGFNPILTGRENVYVNGAVLGLTKKEIDAKFDEIVDFAELWEFIDTPVQSYSSGMQVRLGFAVATTMNPDILLLDEVLAVGDAGFRFKCYNRIASLYESAAVIFVSHSMDQVARTCTKVLMIHSGHILHYGDVKTALHYYEKVNRENRSNTGLFCKVTEPVSSVSIKAIMGSLSYGANFKLKFIIQTNASISQAILRVQFYDSNHILAAEGIATTSDQLINFLAGTSTVEATIGPIHLKSGKYMLSILLYNNDKQKVLIWSYKEIVIRMRGLDWSSTTYKIPFRSVSIVQGIQNQ